MKDFSYITHSHPSYIEGLYQEFVKNPESVDPEFRRFFEGFDFAVSSTSTANGHAVAEAAQPAAGAAIDAGQLTKEFAVYNLILAYRDKGHLVANTNPIRKRKDRGANLDIKSFGLGDGDLAKTFEAGKFIGLGAATLQQILD
ncbi:MAG TPA: 2-oxoglutarate dehydrogenase E1 component, partial [Flavisolibacter sp.]|nr:2-oxoglutarate dehydrogenase E1 component [Flavisolibacter sp.]